MAKKKYTIKDMNIFASIWGGRCLSEEYISMNTHLIWECKNGHQWKAMPKHVKSGHWCRKCAITVQAQKIRKYSISALQQIALDLGGKCLSTVFTNVKIPMLWQCSEGHHWQAPPDRIIHQKSWCPYCAGTAKLTIEYMHEIAEKRGGKCLSSEYVNSRTPMSWECSNKHTWTSKSANILAGSWCPICGGTTKLTMEELKQIAIEKGGVCLSTEYINSRSPMEWQCAYGHKWTATASKIKGGAWCHICSPSNPLAIDDMESVASGRGGKCLSESYINAHHALLWECSEGHQWEATPHMIRQGTWCPECSRGVGERICRAFFQQIFDKPFPNVRPDWLRNKGKHRLELDGYNDELSIAFEHQGVQHYETLNYISHGNKKLKELQARDALKKKICKDRGIFLIEIPEVPTLTPIDSLKEFIRVECLKKGICLPDDYDEKNISLSEAYSSGDFKKLYQLAHEKNGRCLSREYLGRLKKLKWECEKGHQWLATPAAIFSGSWCLTCGYQNSANHKRLTIEEMQKLARSKKGECLSLSYKDAKTHLMWKCAKGHTWKAMPLNIKKGHWCPVCAKVTRGKSARLGLTQMEMIARSRGGRCLSEEYTNARTHLLWECSEGHQWNAIPSSVKRGSWCPICSRGKKCSSTIIKRRLRGVLDRG